MGYAIAAMVVVAMVLGLAEADMAELMDLQSRSPDGVIRMTDNKFRRLASPPRPYSFVIFFDAEQLWAQPELHLQEFRKEFGLVASSFIKHNEEGSGVFFLYVEFKEGPEIFRTFNVQTLPHVRYLQANKYLQDEKSSEEMIGGRNAEGLAAFVTAKTGHTCGSIERPPFLSRNRLLAFLGLFLVSAPMVGKKLAAPRSPLRDTRVWMFGALAIYFFSVSGGMHNIIRKSPLFMVNRNDPSKLVFFYHGSGMQLGTEGFVVGFLYTVVGLLLGFVTHIAPLFSSKNAQRIIMIVAITVSFVAVRKVIALDNWKTGYHIFAFWPLRWM